jgi:hypothetical protein
MLPSRMISTWRCDHTPNYPGYADHLSPDFSPRDILREGSLDDQQVLDIYRMKVLR